MAANSKMLPLGTKAPTFNLLNPSTGKTQSLESLQSSTATVIFFICNHCPYVKHILPHLLKTIKHYQALGIQFIAINANDIKSYPEDGPSQMKELATNLQFTFPFLFDETQMTAKAYQAECTPEFYIFDKNLLCVYRGRYDGSTPKNNIAVDGKDLSNALDNIINEEVIDANQKPSIGCSIKWKSSK